MLVDLAQLHAHDKVGALRPGQGQIRICHVHAGEELLAREDFDFSFFSNP